MRKCQLVRRVFILIVLFYIGIDSNTKVYAQNYQSGNLFYGFYIGIDVGVVNQFEGSPLLGYKITPWWHAGLGGKYQYYYDKRVGRVFRAHIFGPLVLTDIIAIQNLNDILPFRFLDAGLYLHGEMNLFSLPAKHFDRNNVERDNKRFFRPTWLTGIGLRSEAGTGNYLHIMLAIDVSAHSDKIYSNPFVRIGFMF